MCAAPMLSSAISGDRLAARTYDLVAIPSPTGAGETVAERYAELLKELGLDVTIDRHFPGGPNVVGRWRGTGRGVLATCLIHTGNAAG